MQAAQVKSGKGGIILDAGGNIKLLVAMNRTSSDHHETLHTDGTLIQADGVVDHFSDRRKNNQAKSQTQTVQVTSLISEGNLTAHSGGDTLIEASTLNAQGSIGLSATGYAATYNKDGSIKTSGRDGKITFATVKDSTYTSAAERSNSLSQQAQSGHGEYTETLKLANISAGSGLNINAVGGSIIDIPDVVTTPVAPLSDARGRLLQPPPPLSA